MYPPLEGGLYHAVHLDPNQVGLCGAQFLCSSDNGLCHIGKLGTKINWNTYRSFLQFVMEPVRLVQSQRGSGYA